MSDFLQPHGLQHARLLCPSLSPRICSNSCWLSWLCHPTISSSVNALLLLPSLFPSIRGFSNELALCIKCPNYWNFSFSISPSNEYSGLTSFRIDWFDLAVQRTLKSLLQSPALAGRFYLFFKPYEPSGNPPFKNITSVWNKVPGTSLVIQWLKRHTSTVRGMGLIPGQGTKVLHATWHGQKKK